MNVCTYCIYPQDAQLPDAESVPFHILHARAKHRGHTNAWLIACVKNAEQMGLHKGRENINNSVRVYKQTSTRSVTHAHANAWLITCMKNAEQMGLHRIEYIINSVIIYVTTCALTRKHAHTNTSNKHTHI